MENEVFLITLNEDIEGVATEVYVFKDIETCNFKLNDVSWGNLDEDNVRIYHGVVTTANFLPENFKGCTPYIMIKNPEGDQTYVLENEYVFEKMIADPSAVAARIQALLSEDELFISSTYLQQLQPTIHDVQIFFGQRQTPVFQITEENSDEEVMYRLNNLMSEFAPEEDYVTEGTNENER